MIQDMFRVDGKVALVTGAGRGIGRASALALAESGADVVVVSRTLEQVEEVAAEIEAMGRRAVAVSADVVELELPMPIRRMYADQRVRADAGRVALQRGPVQHGLVAQLTDGAHRRLRLVEQARRLTGCWRRRGGWRCTLPQASGQALEAVLFIKNRQSPRIH